MDFRDIDPIIKQVAASYQYGKPPAILLFVQDVLSKIRRFLADLLSNLHLQLPGLSANTQMVGNLMQFLLLLAGAIAVVALLFVAWRRMGALNQQTQKAKRGERVLEVELDAQGWRNQATEFAQNGDYKLACRALYLSLLKRLNEKGVLEFVPTRTNYEYWYALSKHKSIALSFREVADLVESSWFGYLSASKADYERCVRALDHAEQEIELAHQAALAVEKAKSAVS